MADSCDQKYVTGETEEIEYICTRNTSWKRHAPVPPRRLTLLYTTPSGFVDTSAVGLKAEQKIGLIEKAVKKKRATFMQLVHNLDLLSQEEALQAFVQPETLDGPNQYFCERCKKKCDARKVSIRGAAMLADVLSKASESLSYCVCNQCCLHSGAEVFALPLLADTTAEAL